MNCHWCGSSTGLRNSRLRVSDLPRLILFQLPVRCRSCDGRYFANFWGASKLRTQVRERREARRRSMTA